MAVDFLSKRIDNIVKSINLFLKSPDHNIIIESVPKHTLDLLKSNTEFPADLLLILEKIGIMRNWGFLGCAMIDWWIPSDVEKAFEENRCVYELRNFNFFNPENLLFFAWDCDAKCYFYDTSLSPWKLVVCDGLSLSMYNEDPTFVDDGLEDGKITPRVELESPDAISVIERWVNI